jgi:hypothetical protein
VYVRYTGRGVITGGRLTVAEAVAVTVSEGVGVTILVGVDAGGHPESAAFTAASISSTVTSRLASRSMLGQLLSRCGSKAMLTP